MSTNNPMTQEQLNAIKGRADAVTTLRTASFNDWQELALDLSERVDDLLAEVERLRALTTVDEDMVERGVRAFYEHPTPGVDASLRPNWDHLVAASPDVADSYRRHMTAALDAALGTGEGA